VVVWQLAAVVVDPEDVGHFPAWAGGDVGFEHQHVRLPEGVHQICKMYSGQQV